MDVRIFKKSVIKTEPWGTPEGTISWFDTLLLKMFVACRSHK